MYYTKLIVNMQKLSALAHETHRVNLGNQTKDNIFKKEVAKAGYYTVSKRLSP